LPGSLTMLVFFLSSVFFCCFCSIADVGIVSEESTIVTEEESNPFLATEDNPDSAVKVSFNFLFAVLFSIFFVVVLF